MPWKSDLPGNRVQLHRALSKLGFGSRKQAWGWIEAGEIAVDGRVVRDPLAWVDVSKQTITRHGEQAPPLEHVTVALHKPRGIVTTRHDERRRKTVYDLLPPGLPYVFPAGRLDADSEGLLILTSDAQLAVRLTEPEHHVAKTYRVTVNGTVSDDALQQLREGIALSDGKTRPATVRVLRTRGRSTILEVRLTEGRNRQIRRMLAAVGHRVKRLVRTAIGGLALGELPVGECRVLTKEEIEQCVHAQP